jgi:uncharacterized protein
MCELYKKISDKFPVYKIDCGKEMVLYTPGYSVRIKSITDSELLLLLADPDKIEDLNTRNDLLKLLRMAGEANTRWESQKRALFLPECLTIHAGNECNLNCIYCYSKNESTGNKTLSGFPDLNSVKIIIRHIAERVKEKSRRVTVVYHGSGEPAFHWEQLVESFNCISELARYHKLQVFNYIATNGCLSALQADWLAENMDLIGISCDGPPDIQRNQRQGNSGVYLSMEELCVRILKKGGKFEVRVTITKDTMLRQEEIVKYLIENLNARTIRIEPVYLAGRDAFQAKDADVYFDNFIRARDFAEKHSVKVDYSGVRLDELHGTYCDVLRNNLRLTADGLTRNCFSFMNNNAEFVTGRCLNDQSGYYINSEINELKKKALRIPHECNDCINVYHCSRGCPDFCIYAEALNGTGLNGFRCRLHRLITVERITNNTN